jgi:aspartate aminotransferase
MRNIRLEGHVDALTMPENLRIGLRIAKQRETCHLQKCTFDYHGFAFGQSPFHVAPPLARALGQNAEQGEYSPALGIDEVRESISDFNSRYFKADIDPSRIVIGPGTKDIIHLIFDIIKGGVIIPSPSWIGYSPIITLLDKHFHTLNTRMEDGFKVTPSLLERFLDSIPEEQLILALNNPHNPTGNVYFRQELEDIAEVCRERNVLVLADEIYGITTYDFDEFTTMSKIYPEGSLVTNGLSKAWSAGGYRFGYCILPEDSPEGLVGAFEKVAGTVWTNVSTPTQYAAVTAFKENREIDDYFQVTREIHRIMGTYMSEGFNAIEGVRATTPRGAFYFFIDLNEISDQLRESGVADSNRLSKAMIDHPFHVAAVTGDACLLRKDDFGARIAFVDYDGKVAYNAYIDQKPRTSDEERLFVEDHAPRMVSGIEAMERFVTSIKK